MGAEAVTRCRQKRKQDLVYVHGEKCAICGYNKYIGALQFHHLNSQEKEYGLSSTGYTRSWEKDIEESKKCILVCANCHAEIHAELITEELISSFNGQRCQEKTQELKAKKNCCKRCGKKITSGANFCKECYLFFKERKVEHPSREELKQKIRTIPFTQIGKEYGITEASVRKWCDKEGLPRTKKEINAISDEEWKKI